jgi:hypothetical protein
MSLKRTWIVGLPVALGVAVASTLILGLGGVFSCSTYPTYKGLPTDCTAVKDYELYSFTTDPQNGTRNLSLDNFKNWFASADYTPDGGVVSTNDAAVKTTAFALATPVDPIPDGPVCGNTSAVVVRFSHNNDWGGLFGPYDFGTTPQDASDWEGIAFWARAPGNTTKGFTLSLNDNNSKADENGGLCHDYTLDAGVQAQPGGGVGIDPTTGTPLSGSGTTRAPYPDECNNSYTVVQQVTDEWSFYHVPFSAFQQASNPNRVPNSVFDAGTVPGTGLLTSALRQLSFRMPRAAEGELWLSKLAFYRKNKSE